MKTSKGKKILILSYHDFPYEGHGYIMWKQLLNDGYDAYFVTCVSKYTNDNTHTFFDIHQKNIVDRVRLRFMSFFKCRLGNNKTQPDKQEYCYYNTSNTFWGNAKKILRKIKVVPDIIVFAWCDHFISPRVVFDLYRLTKAKMVIIMVDAHLLGGGCHFPCDCKQYETGCKKCPVLVDPKMAVKLYNEKVKYLRDLPLTVIGSNYDLLRAKKTLFLKNSELKCVLNVPQVPVVLEKREARKILDIPNDAFVMLWGAQYTTDKRKGFSLFMKSLEMMSKKIKRKTTVLLLSNDAVDTTKYSLSKCITILQPGFFSQDKLYMAFYASDLYVSSSADDSGPMMVNYSMACGTPVLSFPIGVAIDLIRHKVTGYLAEMMNVEDLAEGMRFFYGLESEELNKMSKECISKLNDIRNRSKSLLSLVVE